MRCAPAPIELRRPSLRLTIDTRHDLQYVRSLVDAVGEDNILFETDFPHPTCLYPAPLETVSEKMATLRPEARRKIMGENAARLYRLEPDPR